MKTIKSLLYALIAFAALAFVGCVKDETYSAGGDLSGDKVYISNTKSVFYVKTAAEKEEAAEANKKLSHGVTRTDLVSFEDDKQIELTIARTGKKLDVLDVDVELTMYNEESSLFILPAGSVRTATGSQTVTYTVPVSFEEGAEKSALVIGFDISKLAENYEYKFNASLANAADGTQYGASSFDFVINHMVPVELPFTDIGTVTLTQSGYNFPAYSNIVIQIHNDDLKVIEAAKAVGKEPELDYVRFFIPKFMYQIVSAAKDAGDDRLSNDDLDYFAEGDGLLLTMTPKYEPVYDYDHATYSHPIYPELYKQVFPIFGIAGIDPTGELNIRLFQSGLMISLINSPLEDGNSELHYTFAVGLFNGYDSSAVRVNNTYTYDLALMEVVGGSLTGSGYLNQIIEFTWDTNKLEDDWANYFKVDYNNDIMYTSVGEGTFKSEYKSAEESKALYKGYEAIAGNTVYYVDDVYGHSTEEASLGLALLWNGTTATVAPEQPTGETAFGKDLYISQSDKIKSAIEFAENGTISKITFGVKLHFADGNIVGDYAETIEFAASDVDFEKFIGSFVHGSTELKKCPAYDTSGEAPVRITPDYGMIMSQVTISKDPDNAPYGVIIDGLIGTAQMQALGVSGGTLKGTYDPVSNSLIIPAQFYYKPVWQLGGMKYFPYFVPVVSDAYVGASNPSDPSTYYYASEVVAEGAECALYLANDEELGEILVLGSSSNDGSGLEINGFAVAYYVYDPYNNEFIAYYYNQEDYLHFSLETIFLPQAAETATASINRKSLRNINPVGSSVLNRPKANIERTAKVYPFGKQ